MKKIFCLFLVLGTPALSCGPVNDFPDRQAALILELQSAVSPEDARQPNADLWEIWLDAPDQLAQDYLDNGLERLRILDFDGAIKGFDALIAYCPHYAEGYNQRAFAYYLREDYAAALPDLDAAIERAPNHVGALAGRALTLLALGRDVEGQQALRTALALHPWLSERGLLKDLPGQEL